MHRSGRSARGGSTGEAIALLGTADYPSYKKVINTLKKIELNTFDRNPPPQGVSGKNVFIYCNRFCLMSNL